MTILYPPDELRATYFISDSPFKLKFYESTTALLFSNLKTLKVLSDRMTE